MLLFLLLCFVVAVNVVAAAVLDVVFLLFFLCKQIIKRKIHFSYFE